MGCSILTTMVGQRKKKKFRWSKEDQNKVRNYNFLAKYLFQYFQFFSIFIDKIWLIFQNITKAWIRKEKKQTGKRKTKKSLTFFKGCVRYIFASLFLNLNEKKCFLFHLKSSFFFRENQISKFYIFDCHDVIKCPSIKQEIHFTEHLRK